MIARLGDSVTFYKIGYQLGFAGGLPLVLSSPTAARRSSSILSCTHRQYLARGVESVARLARHSSPCTPIRRP